MKLTFILFTFFVNFSHPFFLKAEGIVNSSSNQIENTFQEESLIKKKSEIKKIHIVQVGDTISNISKKYGIQKKSLLQLNNLKDENYIYVGQNLKIFDINQNEVNQISEDKALENSYHIVQKGENLTEISAKYGLGLKYLIEINNFNNPDTIKVGSSIILRKKNTINENLNELISVNNETYGPITIKKNTLEKINGRKILNVINQNNEELIISIKCETESLDVKRPGKKWKGWRPAKENFEKNLINDFC